MSESKEINKEEIEKLIADCEKFYVRRNVIMQGLVKMQDRLNNGEFTTLDKLNLENLHKVTRGKTGSL